MSEALIKAITELDEDEAIRITKAELEAGADPMDILAAGQKGMIQVGELFEKGEYYLSELIYSGSIFKEISSLLEKAVQDREGSEAKKAKGTVVIGTIAGDVHDLGKNIVVMLLKGTGYEVVDLGIDVPPEQFVEKVKETGARVLGISALLTTSFPGMKKVVDLIAEAGLRDSVKIMIGGGVMDESCLAFTGADMQSKNAYDAVTFSDKAYS